MKKKKGLVGMIKGFFKSKKKLKKKKIPKKEVVISEEEKLARETWELSKQSYHKLYENVLEKEVKKSISIGQKLKRKTENGVCSMKDLQQITHSKKGPVKMIISTDIGSDVDDALAYLEGLHLPMEDLDILGVITEFGWTGVRAAVAKRVLEEYNKECLIERKEKNEYSPGRQRKFPCLAGDNEQLWTKVYPYYVWHTSYEGISVIEKEELVKLKKNPFLYNKKEAAVEFLIDTIRKYPNEVVVLCIGSLLNVAKAFRKDPKLPKLIKKITFMGLGVAKFDVCAPKVYEFGKKYECPHTNLNCRQDLGAAIEVFNSEVVIQCIGHTVTHGFWWQSDMTTFIKEKKSPYKDVEMTGGLLYVWLSYRTSIFNFPTLGTCPHDCLTITEAVYPNSFVKYVRGNLVLTSEDNCTFVYNPESGRHYVGIDLYWSLWKEKTGNEFCKFLDNILSRPMSHKEMKDLLIKIDKEKQKEIQDDTKIVVNKEEKEIPMWKKTKHPAVVVEEKTKIKPTLSKITIDV